MKKLAPLALALTGTPALAASGPFFSLGNTDFVVWIAFLIFIGVLLYLGVPKLVGGMLDNRAEGIQNQLDEARALRDEAQSILASYERKQKEVAEQADQIVARAKEEAKEAAAKAQEDLKLTIARRMQAAEDQIGSAESAAVSAVRNAAISVAVSAAEDVIAKKLTAKDAGSLIDAAIKDVGDKLH